MNFSYVAAAEILAESSDSFETIVLKFLKSGAEGRNGLKRFLELKLNQLQHTNVCFCLFNFGLSICLIALTLFGFIKI